MWRGDSLYDDHHEVSDSLEEADDFRVVYGEASQDGGADAALEQVCINNCTNVCRVWEMVASCFRLRLVRAGAASQCAEPRSSSAAWSASVRASTGQQCH
jgi:hypothetical protein